MDTIDYTCVCYVPNDPAFQTDIFLNKFTINVFKNGCIKTDYSYFDNLNIYTYSVFEINDNLPFSNYYSEKLKNVILLLNIKDNSDFSIANYTENLYFLCKIFKDINNEYDTPLNIEYNNILYKNQRLYSENRKLRNTLNNIDKKLELEHGNSKSLDDNKVELVKLNENIESNSDYTKLIEEIDNLKNIIESKNTEIKYFKLEIEKLNISLKNKDEIIDKINKLYDKCYDSNMADQLTEAHFHLNKYLSTIKSLKKELEDEKNKVFLLQNSINEKDEELSDRSRMYDKLNENHKKLLITNKNNISQLSDYKKLLFEKNLEIDMSSKKYNDIFTIFVISTILFSIIISINYFIY